MLWDRDEDGELRPEKKAKIAALKMYKTFTQILLLRKYMRLFFYLLEYLNSLCFDSVCSLLSYKSYVHLITCDACVFIQVRFVIETLYYAISHHNKSPCKDNKLLGYL